MGGATANAYRAPVAGTHLFSVARTPEAVL